MTILESVLVDIEIVTNATHFGRRRLARIIQEDTLFHEINAVY